jgi:hypothetical protein
MRFSACLDLFAILSLERSGEVIGHRVLIKAEGRDE